jgi:hypothetical protein
LILGSLKYVLQEYYHVEVLAKRKQKEDENLKTMKLHKYHIYSSPLKRKQTFTWRTPAYLLLVKFAPRKNPKHFVEFFNRVDEKLFKKYGKTRHQMGIHERKTFYLKGDYQLAVLWDAPSKAIAKRFLSIWLSRGGRMSMSPSIGKASNNAATSQARYN